MYVYETEPHKLNRVQPCKSMLPRESRPAASMRHSYYSLPSTLHPVANLPYLRPGHVPVLGAAPWLITGDGGEL